MPEWRDEQSQILAEHVDAICCRINLDGQVVGFGGPGLQSVGLDDSYLQDVPKSELQADIVFRGIEPPGSFSSAHARALKGDVVEWQFRWRGNNFTGKLLPSRQTETSEVRFVDGLFTVIPERRMSEPMEVGLGILVNNVAGMAYRCRNDEAWTMDLVSDGCLALTGHTAEELRSNKKLGYGDLVHADDVDWLWSKCQTNLDAGRSCSNQYRIHHANGEIRWVWDRAQGVYDDEGKLRFIEGLVTDMTSEKEAELAHAALQKQLQESQKIQVVGQLAGGIAHDFNNLLLVMGMNLQLALAGSADWRRYLKDASIAVERAAELTNQLLTFGRRAPTHATVINTSTFIKEHIDFIVRLFPRSIVVRPTLDASTPPVKVDKTQFQQVLSNLCLNARDAMPQGGTLTIQSNFENLDEDFVRLHSWARVGAFVSISVSDTGTGISEETLDQVFEPFFTTKVQGEGTGLGLATAHTIVSEHGGFIRATSELGKGTCFQVFLPVSDEELKASEEAPPEESKDFSGTETILLIDDQPNVLKVVECILKGAGYAVLSASSGAEGIGLAVTHGKEIRLVLMDAIMPGMSGPEAFEQIHKLLPEMPVIFTTGYSGNESAVLQGHDVLRKPYEPDELLARVRTALDLVTA